MNDMETGVESYEDEPDSVKPGQPSIHSIPAKYTKRRAKATEVILSDRIDLIESANTFVALMVDKQQGCGESTEFRPSVELERNEQAAYDAALMFLRNQFKRGATEPEYFVKLTETDEGTEHTIFETE